VTGGSLSAQRGMPADRGWRRQPLNMEGSCDYIKHVVMDSTQGMVVQHGGWMRGSQPLPVKRSYKMECTVLDVVFFFLSHMWKTESRLGTCNIMSLYNSASF